MTLLPTSASKDSPARFTNSSPGRISNAYLQLSLPQQSPVPLDPFEHLIVLPRAFLKSEITSKKMAPCDPFFVGGVIIMKSSLWHAPIFAVPLLIGHFQAAEGQNIRWKTSSAVANGTGCQMGENTALIAAGDQIQVIFWSMGIYLPARSGLPLAQRKACTLSLGADLNRGIYPKEIRQVLNYGGVKSANASAAISGQTTFFGMPLNPLTVALETGTIFNESAAEISSTTSLSASPSQPLTWCAAGFNPSGLLSLRVVTQGSRDSDSEDLLLSSNHYDLKYTATLAWDSCPRTM